MSETNNIYKLHKAIDNLALDEVNILTEEMKFSDRSLNIGLIKAINVFKVSNEAIDIINILLR